MRLLRKYTDNRGSALFMVISTMTAIMISCMAMYFSVISSRSTQYAIFYQQQSKQSASSVNEAVLAGMMDGTLQNLTGAMTNLAEGEKLSAGANNFKELGLATGKESDIDLGAYTMTITRLPNETVGGVEKMVFDISVTSVVNGSNSVYHNIIYYEESKSEAPPAPTQVFAATGYVPNDVFLDGGKYIADLFFDNELTYINAYGGKMNKLNGNMSTGGSMYCHSYMEADDAGRPLTLAVRNNYTADSAVNMPVKFPADVDKSTVLIGGNARFEYHNSGVGFTNANVYILGDLITAGTLDSSANYFVDGNVIIYSGVSPSMDNVYCNGIIDCSDNGSSKPNGTLKTPLDSNNTNGKTLKTWNEMAAENSSYLSVSKMMDTLDEKTRTNTYYKWVINDSQPEKDKYIKELDETTTGAAVKRKLHFTKSNGANDVPTIILKYSNSEKGCIIEDITCDESNNSVWYNTLVIDTGEDENNTYTIRVKPNRDMDGDNVKETFMWYPSNMSVVNPYYDGGEAYANVYMSVIVKGRGSVVVDIPKGVTYQDNTFFKFWHYGWFLLSGGTVTGSGERFNSDPDKRYIESHAVYTIDNGASKDDKLVNFIHRDCTTGDGCEYTETDSTDKCPSCGGKKKLVTCSVHGTLNDYCPACQPNMKNHEGDCKNHVGRKEIDAYLASHNDIKTLMEDSHKKIIYPNTNIFLISCDESANIRLSAMENGRNIIQNWFFGYIYAPYMTFKAYGNNAGGGMARLFGGMTVSDYIIDDSMSIMACWPDKMPNDLMSDECKKDTMQSLASKSWKITLKCH